MSIRSVPFECSGASEQVGKTTQILDRGATALKSGHGMNREFANGIANELRGTGRYQGLQGGIAHPKISEPDKTLRHTPTHSGMRIFKLETPREGA